MADNVCDGYRHVAPLQDAPAVLHDHIVGDDTKTILTESTGRPS
jgi:hypothetical protein